MLHRRLGLLLRRIFIVATLPMLASPPALGEEPGPLQPYNAAIEESSISGVSSGADMASQFGVAWSSIVKGVGIVAGGPFYCAQAGESDFWNGYTRPIFAAIGPCMKGPPPDVQVFTSKADELSASGAIDPVGNLRGQKIYIFHGFNDSVVAGTVTDATAQFYRHYLGQEGSSNLFYQRSLGAGHAQVLQEARHNACEISRSPFINACGYDQAGVILQHIYGALNPPNSGKLSGALKSFAQENYTDGHAPSSFSMADAGYVFVPKECEAGNAPPCRVHIALHGCQQDVGEIGKLYVEDSGYNAWADTNRIIVLYPQTIARPLLGMPPQNPMACWDWWSYITHDDRYVTKSGKQIQAIKAMLDALTAGYKPGSQKPPAAAPGRLAVIDISDTAADLAWTHVSGAKGYAVSRAEADGEFTAVGAASGLSFVDNGLKPSTAYRWRVTAKGGEAAAVFETAAKTPAKIAPCARPGSCPLTNALN